MVYRNILVPLDGSELAECVLPHMEAIARGCGVANVTLVRVVEPIPMMVSGGEYVLSPEQWQRMETENRAAAEGYLSQLVNRVKYDGIAVKAEVLTGGRAAEVIANYAAKNNVDLIIIATHGRSGVSRWVWGSVADRVLHSACVPVLMVRAPGCVPGF